MKAFPQKTNIKSGASGTATMHLSKLLLVVLFSVTLASCQKEVVGPEGPPGQDGNANVQIITVTNQNIFFNPLLNIWELTLAVPEITTKIMGNGTASVFLAPPDSNNSFWTALPGMFSPDLSETPAVHFNFQVSPGSVVIFSFSEPAFEFVDIKVAVIEGNQ
jgi:hypothetical protein